MTMRPLLPLIVTAGLALLGCAPQTHEAPAEPAPPPRDGVLLHVSSGPDDPHRVLMALRMAELMAADRDVLVYFDIQGIGVVLADAVDLTFAEFPSSRTQLARLGELGVPLYACPGCLAAAGKTPEDLAPGIRVADKDAFFDFTKGRILTLDY
ncbi:MAG: DsrE family protein [Thermoanaerobaculales bacterium]|jgi:predicted peroxiredoxin|nr:DsrE family protein [Thermoanaerobaculales bacterium]